MATYVNDDKSKTTNDSDFYEAIPYMRPGQHAVYSDDAVSDSDYDLPIEASSRLTAIMALILLAVIAVAMGLLLAWGVSVLQTSNSPTTSRSILEL